MTGISYPQRAGGRHIDTTRPVDYLTSFINPAGFLHWTLVICLALVLWPATFGGPLGLVMVAGPSMTPTYRLGDAVITWRQAVQVGDIVLFRVPEGDPGEGNPVIHRVVGGDAGGWITQGDNSSAPDQWRPGSQDVLGVAQVKIPLGGRVLSLMRSWWFIAFLGGLATALFLWPDPAAPKGDAPRRGRHLV